MIKKYTGGFNVSIGKRYGMLLSSWVLCFLLSSLIIGFIQYSGLTSAKMRIAMVIQDLMMFVIPALATAAIIARRPADFLMVTSRPGWINVAIVAAIIIVSAPLMQAIIDWNQHLSLPESLRSVNEWIDEAEHNAANGIGLVMGENSVGGLIVSILIIGVLAGFSEELFFRGTLQRIISTSTMRGHLAVWLTAFIFSLMHFQFYGFVPRMILGAFFGYLALWSGSIWLAVAGHVMNNILSVVAMWLSQRSAGAINIDEAARGGQASVVVVTLSVLFTALWIYILYRRLTRSCENKDNTLPLQKN